MSIQGRLWLALALYGLATVTLIIIVRAGLCYRYNKKKEAALKRIAAQQQTDF